MGAKRIQTEREELLNSLTHAFGFVFFVIGTFYIVSKASSPKYTTLQFICVLLFCFSLLLVYSASSLYHIVKEPGRKKKLRILDHISIYYLIAGTYSPVCFIALQDSKGLLLFILVWSLTALGTILKVFFTGKFEIFSLLLYLIMGWVIVLDFDYLTQVVSQDGLWYLYAGGFAYTFGIIFYVLNAIPYNHVIWHLFVLSGSIFHFYFIYQFIL